MPIDTPRRGDTPDPIATHNEAVADITTRLAVINHIEALEKAGLRTRRLDPDGNVIRAWDPVHGNAVVSIVLSGSNTAKAVEAVSRELRRLRGRTLGL